ncbi:ultraviolet-B receptor UVR8-like isoform X1 [Zingiber officinale]|uniref:ultraviolet-B receptor UVR8-like isoform X1 n=1 Tax=Zingiber officinale TaxID=94328 RepID=UPI001C4D6086|nr:ultraviolet-B receptor UVR8-like isoform X1 [Zingiber officinale]
MVKEEEEAEEMTEVADIVHAWSWGAGTDGQLGTGLLQDQLLPQPLSHLPASVSRIACGGAHAIALSGDGSVLTWGRGTQGQLGHGKLESYSQPKLVNFFESFTVSYVSAGWNHSGFVTDTGRLFMCGDGSFGQLGNGDNQSLDHPCEVLFFPSGHVKQIACGMRHSLALVKGPSGVIVYGFGSGRHGQIGRHLSRSQRTVNYPVVVEGLNDSELVSIHASGDHSAALSADGQLYIWGRRFGGNVDSCIPQLVPLSLPISHVAFGWNHALVMAGIFCGLVYMLGGNRHGLLSGTQEANTLEHRLPTSASLTTLDESVWTLERVVFPVKQKVASIAAGAEHSTAVTEKGLVMTWGWGEHGQLGLGGTFDRTAPQIVNLNWNESFPPSQLAVYCGSGFTIVAKSTQ